MKSLGQELLNDGHVVEQRGWGQAAFLQQVAPELSSNFRGSIALGWFRLHNALLAKHGQQSFKRFWIASAAPLLPLAKSQKSIHNVVVQTPDSNMFLFKPSAEIGDYDDLLSDRLPFIALFGLAAE